MPHTLSFYRRIPHSSTFHLIPIPIAVAVPDSPQAHPERSSDAQPRPSQTRENSRPAKNTRPPKRPRRPEQRPDGPAWRITLHDIIFEADTFAGRAFDLVLLVVILISMATIALETLPAFQSNVDSLKWLGRIELACTVIFATEYVLRLICSRHPIRYIFSFWGIIDILSFLPSLLTGFGEPKQRSFLILRSIRLLRVFRVMKMMRMMSEAEELSHAVWSARDKIIVFLGVVMIAVTISGTLMYHVENMALEEGEVSQFTSIPQSMYWAIVTMTTVGYGDIVPKSTLGKVISAGLILLGYSLIIVPSGFVSAEFTGRRLSPDADNTSSDRTCPRCTKPHHPVDANYCNRCGERLAAPNTAPPHSDRVC